ncbi:CoA pyrophosphatase [Pollutimonas harenae]|uniref:CoA pyrophosphatase n=1 Tax=Pollutimonas harenae TaxID=657015 RepID=A0A853H054_9BURK|nr:CoA pyrophosphatase [Pollutimonas harenae]NYT85722.1 CoA pyrophosphatase [Pollutimonas harenae]TEA70792.1 CoA pyrophosphatase [Pollutimonas harenae]
MSQSILPSRNRRIIAAGFDPLTQPIVQSNALQALAPSSLEPDFICSAFSCPINWQVEPVFTKSFQVDITQPEDVVQAAVLFPLVQRPSGLHVLFTRRASHLYDHAGQISFPGGRIEPGDHDAVAAALRETQEEVGIGPEYIQYIGTQPGFLTSTRFTMKPIIGLIRPGFTIVPDITEVAEVFEVPLSVLMDTRLHRLHQANLPDGGHRFYFSLTWKSYFIWGATAALIRNFYHFLAAAETQTKGGRRP